MIIYSIIENNNVLRYRQNIEITPSQRSRKISFVVPESKLINAELTRLGHPSGLHYYLSTALTSKLHSSRTFIRAITLLLKKRRFLF